MSAANEYEVKAAIDDVKAFTVVGVSTTTSNKDGKATEDINALWERFFKESVGQHVPDKIDDVIYAVYSDYEGNHEDPYRVTIGYKTQGSEKTPDSMHMVHIEPQDYGIMSAQGPQPQTLIETWTAIWSSDLNRSFKTDFEVYGPRFFAEGINEILVYIGLEA